MRTRESGGLALILDTNAVSAWAEHDPSALRLIEAQGFLCLPVIGERCLDCRPGPTTRSAGHEPGRSFRLRCRRPQGVLVRREGASHADLKR